MAITRYFSLLSLGLMMALMLTDSSAYAAKKAAKKSESDKSEAKTDAAKTEPAKEAAPAAPQKAMVIIKSPDSQVSGLEWTATQKEGFVPDDRDRYLVIFQGKYAKENWTLSHDKDKVSVGKDKTFSFEIPIREKSTNLVFTAVGPNGEKESESVNIFFPEWEKNPPPPNLNRRHFPVWPSLGFNYLKYTQSGVDDFSQFSMRVKAQGHYFLKNVWEFYGQASFDVFPITKSPSSSTLRELNVLARVYYKTEWFKNPWTFRPVLEYSYTSTFTSPSTFGFKDVLSPTLGFNISKAFNETSSLVLEAKVGPVQNKFSFLSLSSLHWGALLRYSASPGFIHKIKGKEMGILLDYSALKLKLDDGDVNDQQVSLMFEVLF